MPTEPVPLPLAPSAESAPAPTLSPRRLAALRRRLVGVRPTSPRELALWLRLVLGIRVPDRPRLPGADAPFSYLCHAFFESPRPAPAPRDCVVWACRGGGKTFYAAVATMLDLVFKPGIDVCVLGGSAEQSERVHAHLRRLFEREGLRDLVAETRRVGAGRRRALGVTRRAIRLVNASTCEASAQSEASVRGRRPQKMRCDEVELFDPQIWKAAMLTPRSKRCGRLWVHGCVEALSTMHLPYGLMRALIAEPDRRRIFRWGVVDVLERCDPARPCNSCALWPECAGRAKPSPDAESPSIPGHMTIDDAIAMKSRVGENQWRAEMLCERPNADELVLPEWDRATHLLTSADEPAPPISDAGADQAPPLVVCGMDFGFRAPTVILWATVDPSGVVRVFDERILRETRLHEHARAMQTPRRGMPSPAWVGVDPAGHQRSEQTGFSAISALRKAGLVVRARQAPIEAGLDLIRARLRPAAGSPTLFIHERCAGLIEAIETYHYSPHGVPRSGESGGAPAKDGPDHAVDALRYLILNLHDPGPHARGGNYL